MTPLTQEKERLEKEWAEKQELLQQSSISEQNSEHLEKEI